MKRFFSFIICVLLGAGLVVAPSVGATSYDPTGFPGNPPFPSPTAMIDNQGMLGDYLIGNFYRAVANDQFFGGSNVASYVSIENTSDLWVAAHVRLRTGRFSIETIDFPILLSPYDVFWFQFETLADGTVQITSLDKKTIVYSGLNTFTQRPGVTVKYDDATGQLTMTLNTQILESFTQMDAKYKVPAELTQGYMEVIGLFAIKSTNGLNFFDLMKALWADSTGTSIPGRRLRPRTSSPAC